MNKILKIVTLLVFSSMAMAAEQHYFSIFFFQRYGGARWHILFSRRQGTCLCILASFEGAMIQ